MTSFPTSTLKPIDQPLTLFLIGTTGDLAKKKILKAVYSLHVKGILPKPFQLIGNARRDMSADHYREFVKDIVRPQPGHDWDSFADCLRYVPGDVSDQATFAKLKEQHRQFKDCGNHLFYVATLPSLYQDIVKNIKAEDLHHSACGGWAKFMLEKPFGTDLQSAHELNASLKEVFSEEQIYRIDHFLAKETVQNILAFRFANGMFEHLWKGEFIDHIQVNFVEDLGVTGREAFYDSTGAVRDVLQNHLLQMLAVTLMEEPSSLSADDIRSRRAELLSSVQTYSSAEEVQKNVRFGRYVAGEVSSDAVVGYLQERGIPADSITETAVSLKCFVQTKRWEGVPIYVRTGKRMKRTFNEISIQFKMHPGALFCDEACSEKPNVLTFRVQPNEGVVVRFSVKKPGFNLELEDVPMQFCYQTEFQMGLVEAYEKLLHDAVMGEQVLFPQEKGVEAAWSFVQPVLDFQQTPEYKLDSYPAGTWGPESFDQLLRDDDRSWIEPSVEVCQLPPQKGTS